MSRFDELNEFAHSIIYALTVTSSIERLNGSTSIKVVVLPEIGQKKELLKAYLYAQDIILPTIRKEGLSEDNLETWIMILHRLAAKTLLALQEREVAAGQYNANFACIWHGGGLIYNYLLEHYSVSTSIQFDKQLGKYLIENTNINPNYALPFIQLLRKIFQDDSIKVDLHELSENNPCHNGISAISKLARAYKAGYLTSNEKKIVDKIVKFGSFNIPQAMKEFVKETVQQYAAVDKENIGQVAKFLAQVFYKFTDIHPFEDGNGRVATCLMNILLRSFNLPSIVLYKVDDKDNSKSDYMVAMNAINETRTPLELLIAKRIQEAKINPYRDEAKKKYVDVQIRLYEVLMRLDANYPHVNLDRLHDEKIPEHYYQTAERMEKEKATIYIMEAFLTTAQKEEIALRTNANAFFYSPSQFATKEQPFGPYADSFCSPPY